MTDIGEAVYPFDEDAVFWWLCSLARSRRSLQAVWTFNISAVYPGLGFIVRAIPIDTKAPSVLLQN